MKKKTGSTATYMTYGEYLLKYPQGRINENAKKNELGYCIISNQDKNNICWISTKSFRLINAGLKASYALDVGDMETAIGAIENLREKITIDAKKNLDKFMDAATKNRVKRQKEIDRQTKRKAAEQAQLHKQYIKQCKKTIDKQMENATGVEWQKLSRFVKQLMKSKK